MKKYIKKSVPLALLAVMALSSLWLSPLNVQAAYYSSQQVSQHNSSSSCWMIVNGKVYDVTSYIASHPGGSSMVNYCGQDATSVFASIHNQAGYNALASYLIGDVMLPLTQPVITSGTSTQTTALINWSGSTGGIAPITYTILRNAVPAGTTTSTSFIDTGLTASTPYSYVVRATDSATTTPNSVSSAAFAITTLAATTTPDTTSPTAPTGLAFSNITASSLTLSWASSTDSSGVAGYKVFRNGIQIATTTGLALSDSGLAPLTSYSYRVSAFDASGNVSALSSPANATTLAASAPATSTISIVSPVNGSTVSGKIAVAVSIPSANSAFKKLQLYVDGKKVKTKVIWFKIASGYYSFKWNTKGVPNGSHSIQAVMYDLAGKQISSSQAVNITVSNANKNKNENHEKKEWKWERDGDEDDD